MWCYQTHNVVADGKMDEEENRPLHTPSEDDAEIYHLAKVMFLFTSQTPR